MTDPIEQARHSALIGASNAVVLGILAGDAYEPMIAYEQAILRYHPDVVRLVLAARRLAEQVDEGDVVVYFVEDFDVHDPLDGLTAALAPFTEVQE